MDDYLWDLLTEIEEEKLEIDAELLLSSPLASTKSMQISLKAIREGDAGLNKHRQSLLDRVPKQNDFAGFERDSIDIKDLAYLSAATGDEFALMRGKKNDVLFHGTKYHCNIDEDLIEALKAGKFELIAHSHPDYGEIEPSSDDRRFLREIQQKESIIISYITGQTKTFTGYNF